MKHKGARPAPPPACFADLGLGPGDLPESERAALEVMSIPVFPELTQTELEEVATAIEEFYA